MCCLILLLPLCLCGFFELCLKMWSIHKTLPWVSHIPEDDFVPQLKAPPVCFIVILLFFTWPRTHHPSEPSSKPAAAFSQNQSFCLRLNLNSAWPAFEPCCSTYTESQNHLVLCLKLFVSLLSSVSLEGFSFWITTLLNSYFPNQFSRNSTLTFSLCVVRAKMNI